jgi:hypothetical protein
MSEKIQLTPLLYPLLYLDMCNAIQLQKDIRENYAEARAGDRAGFFVAPRACPSSTGGTADAISEGSKRQPGRPAARIAQSPKGARAKLA